MDLKAELVGALNQHPRVRAVTAPTVVEPLKNLGADLKLSLWAKRDDALGFGFGGNKVRQLEYYLGRAVESQADSVLITGAIQSNFVRTAAAMANRHDMHCHIQLEHRVENKDTLYLQNGNVLLDHLLGATLHMFPPGGSEAEADQSLDALAADLESRGKTPFIIHLGDRYPPIGAMGYVAAALEFSSQLADLPRIDRIYIPSGSALTHVGLLFGLRALGIDTPIVGVCVRRDEHLQRERVAKRFRDLSELLQLDVPLSNADIQLDENALAPGYGMVSAKTKDTLHHTARREGMFLDPVYSGKTMAAIMDHASAGKLRDQNVLFWHTGGLPALFAYANQLVDTSVLGTVS